MPFDAYTTGFFKGLVPDLTPVNTFFFDTFFTEVIQSDEEEIVFDKQDLGRGVAPFVRPMDPARGRLMPGYQTNRVRPAYLKPKSTILPDRVIKRRAGEQPFSGSMTPGQRLNAVIVDDTQLLYDQVKRRWELMAIDAWEDGIVTCTGPDGDVLATVNYGRPAALTVTLSGGDRWGQVGVSPLRNLQTWRTTFLREAKLPADRVVVDVEALALLQADPQWDKQVDVTRRGSRGEMNYAAELAAEGAELIGYLNQTTEIWLYTGWYTDPADNTVKSIIPANTVYLGSSAPQGAQLRAFGTVQDAQLGFPQVDFAVKITGIEGDPSIPTLVAHSAPLPVLQRPEASFRARVA